VSLLVIVPSRGRPASVHRLCQEWAATSTAGAELLVCLDDDDLTADDYPTSGDYPFLWYSIGPRDGFAPRLSAEAVDAAPLYDVLGSWGDDHVPRTPGWDRAILDALPSTGFAYGDDLIQGERIPTACHMTSDIVTALGWMTPPGFAHMYVDDVWRDLGQAIDRITYLPDVIIEHLHPLVLGLEADALVIDANSDEAMAADRHRYQEWKTQTMPGNVATLQALL
jgi:hypothetical protein